MIKTKTDTLNYDLSKKNIAQTRYENPNESKLLIADTKEIITFKELKNILPKKSVLVFNKSTVEDVRIKTTKKDTGGKIEIFILNKISNNLCECLLKFNGTKNIGTTLNTVNFEFKIMDKKDEIFIIKTSSSINNIIKNYGLTPLPPYIKDNKSQYKYYKTDYSKGGFSIAASTAGLHFNKEIIDKFKKDGIVIKYINLDIGLGTFKPINTEYINEYEIHKESYSMYEKDYIHLLKLKENGYVIISIGTTVLRTLETIALNGKFHGDTNLYITPGFNFKIVDFLITNFHAPKSTLLSIVLTIYGKKWKELYMYAQKKKLKFLSFGDAVLFKIK
ncbi:MAG: hypothetical protein EVA29_02195 [Candidatus Actinomarinales bacterium]|nr:MAG: hypothetical protein EVA29_02195 [Candidatus Actinomarinales bacterium]